MQQEKKEPRICVTCVFQQDKNEKNKPHGRVCRACVSRSRSSVKDQTDEAYAPNWRKIGSKPRGYMPGMQLRADQALVAISRKEPMFWNHKFEQHTWMEQLRLKTIVDAAKLGILFEAIKIENKGSNI